MRRGGYVTSARSRVVAGLTAVLLAVGGVVGGVAPAAVAAGDYLQIDKSVDKPLSLPGDTFTSSVKVTCSEVDCLDTQLTDVLPAALAGFPIEDVVFTPQTTPIVVTWSSDIPLTRSEWYELVAAAGYRVP